MTIALPMLLGGVLFLVADRFGGHGAITLLAVVLLAIELWYDLGLHRNHDQRVAYRRMRGWRR